jgi:hypothetical protein
MYLTDVAKPYMKNGRYSSTWQLQLATNKISNKLGMHIFLSSATRHADF